MRNIANIMPAAADCKLPTAYLWIMAFLFFERMIASRMSTQKDASGRMSKPIVRVAVGGIAVGMAVMIMTLAVMNGFQQEIKRKVIGFGSHIQITGYDTNESFEMDSLSKDQPTIYALKGQPGIKHIQVFATKAGIIKSGEQLMGVVLKGIDKDFDWDFFKKNLKEGELLSLPDTMTTEVMVSRHIADKMNLTVGKKFRMFFLRGNETKQRAFKVAGIYETGLTDGFDDRFILCDIRQVQTLNDWSENTVAGFEVLVDNFDDIETATDEVNASIDIHLIAQNIRELNPQIFSWLDVLDVNAIIIIILMLFVSMINMISALIILILDRTNMIGIMKAMGATDRKVMRIFLIHAAKLIWQGMLYGNVLGLLMCFLQWNFHWVSLDETSYYVKYVPVEVNWMHLGLLNLAAIILCQLALFLPALVVTRISPVKAIRFS